MDTPKLGQLIEDGDRRRDAIHIAIAPVTAFEDLQPGERAGFIQPGDYENVGACRNGADKYAVGIVDPYLREPVRKGQRFWLFLFPNTVTSLRHQWSHPLFGTEDAPILDDLAYSEQWLRRYAAKFKSYGEPGEAYQNLVNDLRSGELYRHDGCTSYSLEDTPNADELKQHAERVLGIRIDWNEFTFRCGC